MLIKFIKPDFEFESEKGLLVQLVHAGWNQVNVLKSPKGSKRGGHFHKENEEAFYIIDGSVKLILDSDEEHEETNLKRGDMFMISPYLLHNFEFYEDTTMVSMYSKGVEHEDGTKDIYAV
ncbi:MAG: cupin domain-containing protein [Lachnospiraceae bacterium]|nr:cupin domain-containing protein [Lachnospiraceae bacterium]